MRISLQEARERFGNLTTDTVIKTYLEFVDEDGRRWVPEYSVWLNCIGYRSDDRPV